MVDELKKPKSLYSSGLIIGNYYYEAVNLHLTLAERIEKAARAYYMRTGLKPDTVHVSQEEFNPKEEKLLIGGDFAIGVYPDTHLRPNFLWMGNKGLEKIPKDLTPEEQEVIYEETKGWVVNALLKENEEEAQRIEENRKRERRRLRRQARREAKRQEEEDRKKAEG